MTKNEREALAKLCRQREKFAKAEADVRGAVMRADFEKQLAAIYSYDDHAVWQQAYNAAAAAVKKEQKIIEATFKDLGIPRQFAPELSLQWYRRGENAVKERRAEFTKVGLAEFEEFHRVLIFLEPDRFQLPPEGVPEELQAFRQWEIPGGFTFLPEVVRNRLMERRTQRGRSRAPVFEVEEISKHPLCRTIQKLRDLARRQDLTECH